MNGTPQLIVVAADRRLPALILLHIAFAWGIHLNWYGSLRLETDFSKGTWKDGSEIAFTRGEAKVLATLVANAPRVVSRTQILDAISGEGSDKNDRVVDFIVNRLRNKLGDNPRAPQFIATRYGEGYVWKAVASNRLPAATGAHVVIGPVRGLAHLGAAEDTARHFLALLDERLRHRFGAARSVVLDPDCPPVSEFASGAPEIGVAITFLRDGNRLDCVVHATAFRTGMSYTLSRHAIALEKGSPTDLPHQADRQASRIVAEIWKAMSLASRHAAPLALAMHNAAQNLQPGLPGWAEANRHLRELVERNPTDPALKMMLATNIHSKYVQHGLELFAMAQDSCEADEAEMEALVTESLPLVQNDPFMAAAAAKLLHFLRPAYRAIALDLIEGVYRSTVALPPALIVLGALRSYSGRVEAGLAAFDQALEATEPGSESEVYILCLKCQAHMAIDDRPGLDRVLQRLYALRPPIRPIYDIFYGPEEQPSPAAAMALQHMSSAQARGMLRFLDYLCARHFDHEEHRTNSLRIPVKLLSARFGHEVAAGLQGAPLA